MDVPEEVPAPPEARPPSLLGTPMMRDIATKVRSKDPAGDPEIIDGPSEAQEHPEFKRTETRMVAQAHEEGDSALRDSVMRQELRELEAEQAKQGKKEDVYSFLDDGALVVVVESGCPKQAQIQKEVTALSMNAAEHWELVDRVLEPDLYEELDRTVDIAQGQQLPEKKVISEAVERYHAACGEVPDADGPDEAGAASQKIEREIMAIVNDRTAAFRFLEDKALEAQLQLRDEIHARQDDDYASESGGLQYMQQDWENRKQQNSEAREGQHEDLQGHIDGVLHQTQENILEDAHQNLMKYDEAIFNSFLVDDVRQLELDLDEEADDRKRMQKDFQLALQDKYNGIMDLLDKNKMERARVEDKFVAFLSRFKFENGKFITEGRSARLAAPPSSTTPMRSLQSAEP